MAYEAISQFDNIVRIFQHLGPIQTCLPSFVRRSTVPKDLLFFLIVWVSGCIHGSATGPSSKMYALDGNVSHITDSSRHEDIKTDGERDDDPGEKK